jgi:hypothetical protein
MYESQKERIRNEIPVSPYTLEVTGLLERTLAFAYTGDARVITKDLMEPFGLKRSLIEHGLPCILKSLNFNKAISQLFAHNATMWPLTRKTKEPAVSSKRAQMLTYGEDHFLVRDKRVSYDDG